MSKLFGDWISHAFDILFSHGSQGCHLDTGIHWQSSLQPEVLCPLAGLFGTGADVGLDGQT